MLIISHRGNLNGPEPLKENLIDSINLAIHKGFDVELDLWYIDSKFFLGHDSPKNLISIDLLFSIRNKLWIHCKNRDCLEQLYILNKDLNYFWHETDKYTITSKGFFWIYPNTKPIFNGILVTKDQNINQKYKNILYGICTDYPLNFGI